MTARRGDQLITGRMASARHVATRVCQRREPLDVWLRIPEDADEAEAEANTYSDGDGYRVDWSLTSVGLVKSRTFATRDDARAWLTSEGFEDYTS